MGCDMEITQPAKVDKVTDCRPLLSAPFLNPPTFFGPLVTDLFFFLMAAFVALRHPLLGLADCSSVGLALLHPYHAQLMH
jgi:hypothetical protein